MVAVVVGFYVLIAAFFAPVAFQGKVLGNTPDMVAAASMNRVGEDILRSGRFPLWNPTLFCGMPMFASLQYAIFVYPADYVVRLLGYIFGGSHYRFWLFHYFMAALFAYLLARHYGLGRLSLIHI